MNTFIKNSLVGFLKIVYNSTPLMVIRTNPFAYDVWNKIRSFCLPLYLYKGKTLESGRPLNFSYLGWNNKYLNYWLSSIYEEHEQIPCKRLIPFWKIHTYLTDKNLNCELAMVELTNSLVVKCTSKVPGFVLPRWVKMYMDVDLSLSLVTKHKFTLRIMRKYALDVEKGYSNQDFDFFYKEMYGPYIKSRHKESAVIYEYKELSRSFRCEKSTIYFVIKDGVRIAGLFVQHLDGIPTLRKFGILGGSNEILRMGVTRALYYYALKDFKQNKFNRVNIGGTSPLIQDGVTNFKLSHGAKVSEMQYQDSPRIKMFPLEFSTAVKEFLTANSFITIENDFLYCIVFKDETNEKSAIKSRKLYDVPNNPNVKKTRYFCFDSQNKFKEYDTES